MPSHSNLVPSGPPPRRFGQQSFRRIARETRDVGLSFSDDQFRPQDKSIFTTSQYRNRMNIGRVRWLRPKELSYDLRRGAASTKTEENAPTRLLPSRSEVPSPFPGHGPNPWLVAACVAVLQHQKLARKLIRSDDEALNSVGMVRISVWQFGTWQKIVLDDKLPCDMDGVPIFAHPLATNVCWAIPFLEKAFAKVYNSYENLATKATLTSVLIDLTGGGTVESLQLDDAEKPEGEQVDVEQIISKEFHNKSLLLVKSKSASMSNLDENRFYLVSDVKRSHSAGGTIRRTLNSIGIVSSPVARSAEVTSVVLMATQMDNSSNPSAQSKTMSITELKRKFDKLIIARPYALNMNRIHRLWAKQSSAQFIFDVTVDQTNAPVVITLQQSSNCSFITLGFRLYSVELNRSYRVHNFALNHLLACRDPVDDRQATLRHCSLPYGRYLVSPICHQPLALLLSIDSPQVTNLAELKHEMPRQQMFSFTAPKYPICVSRVSVKRVTNLTRQDRFGGANPYCIIRCDKQMVKSTPQHDTLEPSWLNLSALFYHRDNITPIRIEVWHRSLVLVDNLIGQVEITPKFRAQEDTDKEEQDGIHQLELTNKKGVSNGAGIVHFELLTYEDLKYF